MHCKYLSVVPYKALEKFSKALYGTTGSTYSAQGFRPLMKLTAKSKVSKFSPRSPNKSGAIGLNTIYSFSPSALNFPGPN